MALKMSFKMIEGTLEGEAAEVAEAAVAMVHGQLADPVAVLPTMTPAGSGVVDAGESRGVVAGVVSPATPAAAVEASGVVDVDDTDEPSASVHPIRSTPTQRPGPDPLTPTMHGVPLIPIPEAWDDIPVGDRAWNRTGHLAHILTVDMPRKPICPSGQVGGRMPESGPVFTDSKDGTVCQGCVIALRKAHQAACADDEVAG